MTVNSYFTLNSGYLVPVNNYMLLTNRVGVRGIRGVTDPIYIALALPESTAWLSNKVQ